MIIFNLKSVYLPQFFASLSSNFSDLRLSFVPLLIVNFFFLFSSSINGLDQFSFSATVNGPLFTKYIGNVEGSNLFKITVGLTNLTINKVLAEVCAAPSEDPNYRICNITNVTSVYEKDFPLKNCPSCTITIGTFVFPKQYVPENAMLDICATNLNNQLSSCIVSKNTERNIIEDAVIPLK